MRESHWKSAAHDETQEDGNFWNFGPLRGFVTVLPGTTSSLKKFNSNFTITDPVDGVVIE